MKKAAHRFEHHFRFFWWFSRAFSASQKVPWFPAGEVLAVALVWFVRVI
jgi:hypothetical protein